MSSFIEMGVFANTPNGFDHFPISKRSFRFLFPVYSLVTFSICKFVFSSTSVNRLKSEKLAEGKLVGGGVGKGRVRGRQSELSIA
jgi:hypothetical protein